MIEDDIEDPMEIARVAESLREGRLDLRRTVRAIQHGQRTPADIRAVVDDARRTVHKSRLIVRKLKHLWRVH